MENDYIFNTTMTRMQIVPVTALTIQAIQIKTRFLIQRMKIFINIIRNFCLKENLSIYIT